MSELLAFALEPHNVCQSHDCSEAMILCMCRSFVIEKQPPQVIKTSNRFSTSVR